jgi:hypothetical protein
VLFLCPRMILFFNFLKRSADYFLTNQYNIEMRAFC